MESQPSKSPASTDPNSSWWESISRARSRIESLSKILDSSADLTDLADSDQPARSLLDSPTAYAAIGTALSRAKSGSGDDALCQWLYETYQAPDPDLRLIVLSFVPLISGIYLSRAVGGYSSSLSGFEAVILSIYSSEAKARGGKPVLIQVPDLSQPSLYHTTGGGRKSQPSFVNSTAMISPPLEPQTVVKSTKRACIVGVALDCYYKRISMMPSSSKIDFCEFVAVWAGDYYSGRDEIELFGDCGVEMEKLGIGAEGRGERIPFPWELMQPVLRILGHCLLAPLNSKEVKDAASISVRRVYGRASHDLLPQGILASRSLIQIDRRAREAEIAAAAASSHPSTPSKPKKPEVHLSSK